MARHALGAIARAGALAVALAASCAIGVISSSAAAATAKFRFGLSVADNVVYAPVLAAAKLGFFADAKLDVDIVPLRGVSVAEEALAAGHVEIIDHTAAYAARAISGGAKLKVVATATNGFYGWTLIVRTDSPARGVRDLVGEKIGIGAAKSISGMAARRLMDQTSGSYKFAPTGPGALMPALRNGELQGVLFSAAVAQREVGAGNARTILDLTDLGDRTAIYGYSASAAAIEKRPEDLRAFLAAVRRATEYMKANREWSVRFIKSYVKVDNEDFAEMLHDRVVAELSASYRTRTEAVERALALAARAWDAPGLLELDPASVFTNQFLPGDGT